MKAKPEKGWKEIRGYEVYLIVGGKKYLSRRYKGQYAAEEAERRLKKRYSRLGYGTRLKTIT